MSKFAKALATLIAVFFLAAACTPSPKAVCKKIAKNAGEDVSSEELGECEEALTQFKDLVDGKIWKKAAKCMMNAEGESDARACMTEAAEAAGM